jgi:hypothetical protein
MPGFFYWRKLESTSHRTHPVTRLKTGCLIFPPLSPFFICPFFILRANRLLISSIEMLPSGSAVLCYTLMLNCFLCLRAYLTASRATTVTMAGVARVTWLITYTNIVIFLMMTLLLLLLLVVVVVVVVAVVVEHNDWTLWRTFCHQKVKLNFTFTPRLPHIIFSPRIVSHWLICMTPGALLIVVCQTTINSAPAAALQR